MQVIKSYNRLANCRTGFPLLPDTPSIYDEWRQLVVTYDVSGAKVHDARLVAAMVAHGVKRILTFDDDLRVMSPKE